MPTTLPWCFDVWGDVDLAEGAREHVDSLDSALDWIATDPGLASLPLRPSWTVLSALATLGSVDLSIARAAEPHLDARTILAQAADGTDPPSTTSEEGSTWGVYAANPAGSTVRAAPTDEAGQWTLTGRKLWCSLPQLLTHALVSAPTDGGQGLFAVSLRDPSVQVSLSQWRAHGLREVSTGTIDFEQTAAWPVGAPGWYLERPGFSWGGVAVAAVWFGGAAAVAGALWQAAAQRGPDQVALMHMGRCDQLLHSALLCLRDAVRTMAVTDLSPLDASLTAARARAQVADAAEQVLSIVGHALGPGPLAFDVDHLQRVSDLTLYIRQHHAERDLARLGRLLLPAGSDADPGSAR